MFHFLLMAVSYAALLLLLMPASIPGIAAAAVLIAAGVVVMLVKKIYRIPFYSRIDTALVPITGITAASFGLGTTWCRSSSGPITTLRKRPWSAPV